MIRWSSADFNVFADAEITMNQIVNNIAGKIYDKKYAYMYKNYQMTCIGEIADKVNLRIHVNCWS